MEKDKRESKEASDRSRKVAKPVLQESVKTFRQVIEASPVPMVISDRNGNTEFVNRKFVDLFGYTLKELPTVENWWLLAYPDEEYRREVRERWESAVKKAMKEKTEMEPLETKVTCKDGSVRHVLFRFSPVDDRNLVVLDDITERKRGEEEMREMSEAAMQFVDFPPERDMYDFICEKVKGFIGEGIVSVNSIDLENDTLQIRKVLGIGPVKMKMIDKLLGRKTTSISLSGIFQEAKDALTGGKLAKVEGGLYTAFFQKFPKTVCQQIEKVAGIKGIHSIGLRRKGKLLGSVTILASKNSRVNKNVIETFVNQASIALERKQAEEALRESQNKLNVALEGTGISVWDWRVKTGDISFDDHWARILGYEPGEMKFDFDWWQKNVHPDSFPVFQKALEAYLKGRKEHYELEYRMQTKSGQWKWIWARGICTERDEKGEPLRFLGTHRDITERKRAEEALRLSERKFRSYIENAPDGVLVVDREGKFLEANAAACRIGGYSREELLEKSIPETLAPESKEAGAKHFRQVVAEGRATGELAYIRKDGTTGYWSVDAVKIAENRFLGFVKDTTERKLAEEKVKQAAEEWETTFNSIPDLVSIIGKDHRFVKVNKAYANVFGIGQKELVGRTCHEVIHGRTEPWPNCPHKQAIKTKKPVTMEFFESRLKIHLEVSVSPIFDEKGQVTSTVHIAKNITERKRAEEALRETEARYRDLFQSANDVVLLVDAEGNIKEINRMGQEISGYRHDELTQMNVFRDLIVPDDHESMEKVMDRLREGKGQVYQVRWRAKDGTVIPFEGSSSSLISKDGSFIHTRCILRDITERKRAEEQIKLKSQFLESLIEQSPLPTFVIDSNGICVMVNRAFLKAYNVPQKEMVLGMNALTEPANVRQGVVKYIKEALSGKKVETPETEFISPYEDKRVVTKSKLFPIFDATSKLTNVVVLHEDITERKRAEEAVEKERQRLFSVLDVMPAFVYLQASDYSVPYVNRRFREMFGDPGDHPCYEVFHGRKEPCDPCITLRVLETRAPQTWEWTSKDGRTYMIYEDLFPGTEGEDLVLEIGVDITQRKRAEEALRESEEKYRKLFETETDAIMVFDAQTRQFVDVNDAAVSLYGYSREEFLKLKHPDITAEPDESEVSIEQTLSGELTKIPVRYHKKKDGTIFPVEISASSFVLKGCKVLCGVIRDITEREKLREQLIQSEKLAAVGTLAYGIAHEFNNILAGMMVNAELGGGLTDKPEIKECFDSIVENAGRGSSITNSLLAVAGERKEKKELTDLTRPLENVLSFSRRELEKANIKVVEDFRPIPEILCDPGQFSEVYLNIINNARDAMQPEGGTLTVNLAPYKGNIRIVFKDTGCGIPDEIKNKIFDPFVTTKGALGKSEVPGTGLGLFLTYGIVNSYRGRIEVESETGKGTTFTILIPVSRNLPSEAPPKRETVPAGEIDRQLNILLIDDEKIICNVLKRFLESKGHKVTTSLEGSEGFEHFKKDKFDVVLSDITMPGMDGIELIKLMRRKDKDSKIIAITGHVQQQKLDAAKDAGAQEVLIKPFRNAKLYETIARLLLETARKDHSGTGTEHNDQNLT